MNPFDWRGPQFLGFYVIASIIGFILMYLVARGLFTNSPRSPSAEGRRHLRDPYLLAYLRGGVPEALKIVMFSLNKRKLMLATRDLISSAHSRDALQAIKNPLERAVFTTCAEPREGLKVIRDGHLKDAVEQYAAPLRETGLILNDEEIGRRLPAFIAIGGTLLALGAIKLFLALQRGHANVVFLIFLAIVVLIWLTQIFRRRRTSAGDQALSDQQVLFGRLRNRAKRLAADGATDEAVLVAAAFGLQELSPRSHPFVANLKRQLTKNENSSSGCSSGCGSSCGGGGCGGGCGGCGS